MLTCLFPVMLKCAIQQVVDDPSYHLKVEPRATALRQARCIAEWSTQEENNAAFNEFEARLLEELWNCVPRVTTTSSVRSFGTVRTDICRNYHSLRTSAAFTVLWSEFIKCTTSDTQPQPTFYQEVIFERIIALALPVTNSAVSDTAAITYDDSNVINYAAGYVCRKVHNTVARSSIPEKADVYKVF